MGRGAIARGVAIVAAVLCTAAAARAEGADVVWLKNGGSVRGRLLEVTTNVRVRVQLPTGEVRSLAWGDVEGIDPMRVAPEPPESPETPAPTEAPAPPSRPQAWLHIDAPADTRLQEDTTGDDGWVTVCRVPCDKQLPTDSSYRIVGTDIRRSEEFMLRAGSGGRETISVDGASKSAFVVGLVFLPIGGVATLSSLFAFLVGGIQNGSGDENSNATSVGWTLLIGGALVTTIGVVMVKSNDRSKVSQATTFSRPRAPTAQAPSWRELEVRGVPAAIGIPILRGSF